MTATKWYFLLVHFIVLQKIAQSTNATKESNRFLYCYSHRSRGLKQKLFWSTQVNRNWAFRILGQWFPTIFGQIVYIKETTLSNTNMVMSRFFKREKALLPVDVRHSKTS